ncbi:MAG: flavin-containing monooxygenase [Planctomycetota bacterium]|jgi:cation diffusion facilitator CzcD-associated flavoprotein CzcO
MRAETRPQLVDDFVDVLIVGAGISGIGAAYHLQSRCPGRSYAILERRENLGGTWDLFRYPGIRSDSDMHTLGYSFRPWSAAKAIADGPAILEYLQATVQEYGIDRKIRYGQHVEAASWSTPESTWTVRVRDVATGQLLCVRCNFLFMCSGYYNYAKGYTPEFEGVERFGGRIVHPQKWTDDVEFAGKRVVVIGSGATAITLIPALAQSAKHVTMLQRSPTYIVVGPSQDRIATWLRDHAPKRVAYGITRWKNVLYQMGMYRFCRTFPRSAKKMLVGQIRKLLGEGFDVDKHFSPRYSPWDQRVCLAPDGDFFEALKSGTASVVTDQIERFSRRGIKLRSGAELEADLIVTATGLQLQFLGGMSVEVDGAAVEPTKTMTYKGMMFSDVPNLAIALGYTNASWTLKADLTCEYVCRLLNHMKKRGHKICCPRRNDDPNLEEAPLLDFAAGYVQRSVHEFPKQGSFAPWKLYQNYALDLLAMRYARLNDRFMEFSG